MEDLRGKVTLPVLPNKSAGYKSSNSSEATALLRGPYRQQQSTAVWDSSERKTYCSTGIPVPPVPETQLLPCHSGRRDLTGELTLSHVIKAQSKRNFTITVK